MRLWVPGFQIKVREKRDKRDKSPSRVPACRFFLDHGSSALWVCDFMTNGAISLPTRYGLASAPSVIQRPCHLAWKGLRPVSGGVASSKLSILLNQENALSAPCICGDFCSPQAPSRGAGTLRTGVIRRFRCHITVCDHRIITPTSADAFPVVGGRCTGRARRCKAKQGRREKRR
jgi:hypothetical protein